EPRPNEGAFFEAAHRHENWGRQDAGARHFSNFCGDVHAVALAAELVDGRQHQPIECFERFDVIHRRYAASPAHLFERILLGCGRQRPFCDTRAHFGLKVLNPPYREKIRQGIAMLRIASAPLHEHSVARLGLCTDQFMENVFQGQIWSGQLTSPISGARNENTARTSPGFRTRGNGRMFDGPRTVPLWAGRSDSFAVLFLLCSSIGCHGSFLEKNDLMFRQPACTASDRLEAVRSSVSASTLSGLVAAAIESMARIVFPSPYFRCFAKLKLTR